MALLTPVVERRIVHDQAQRVARAVLGVLGVLGLFALIGPDVLLFLSPASLLVGTETEQTATLSTAAKQMAAQLLECTTEGDVDFIHIHGNATEQSATTIWVAIFAEGTGGGAGSPGTLLKVGKTESKPGTNAWYEVKLNSTQKVVKGTLYWLVALGATNALRLVGKTGGSAVTWKESTASTFTEPAETAAWTGKAKGPMSIYATGAVSGGPNASNLAHMGVHSGFTGGAMFGPPGGVPSHGAVNSTHKAGAYAYPAHMAVHSPTLGEAISFEVKLRAHMAVHTSVTGGQPPEIENPPELEAIHNIVSHAAVHSSVSGYALNGSPEGVRSHLGVHSPTSGFQLPQMTNAAHGGVHSAFSGGGAASASNTAHMGVRSAVSGFQLPQASPAAHMGVNSTFSGSTPRSASNITHAGVHSTTVSNQLPQTSTAAHMGVHSAVSGGALTGASNVTHMAVRSSVAGGYFPSATNTAHGAVHSLMRGFAQAGSANVTHVGVHSEVSIRIRERHPPTAAPREHGHIATGQPGSIR